MGDRSDSINFTLIIEDPCFTHGSLTIDKHIFDLTKNSATMIATSVDYFLGYPQIDYLWDQSTIAPEIAVSYDCGPTKVEIFMDDGQESAFDNNLFDHI